MDQHQYDEFGGEGIETRAEPQLLPRAKPDSAADPAGEAGWYLEREREQRGLSLDDAAHATGIHPYHIQAIEYGDMTHMPPRLEALEMIAAYANFLGFDPEPLLEHYITFLPQPELAPRQHPANPAPLSSAKIMLFGKFPKIPPINIRVPSVPGGRNGIVASIAAVLLLLGGTSWILSPSSEPQGAALEIASNDSDPMPTSTTGSEAATVKVTEKPLDNEALAGIEDAPVAAPEEDDADMAEKPEGLGAFIAEQLAGTKEPEAVASVAPVQKNVVAVGEDGRIFGSTDSEARVVLKATRSIWLLIEDTPIVCRTSRALLRLPRMAAP
jgi:cytoskeleton protein RodZ